MLKPLRIPDLPCEFRIGTKEEGFAALDRHAAFSKAQFEQTLSMNPHTTHPQRNAYLARLESL